MPRLIVQKDQLREIIRKRRRLGLDRFDEVWNGVYVMAPGADIEHQSFAVELSHVLRCILGEAGRGRIFVGCNYTDQDEDWSKNYRCPDVSVVLQGNPAIHRGTHWFGGPDLAVEILSPKDRSHKKVTFYNKVGVRELWLVDRNPWQVELYQRIDGELKLTTTIPPGGTNWTASNVMPLDIQLRGDAKSAKLAVRDQDGGREWVV